MGSAAAESFGGSHDGGELVGVAPIGNDPVALAAALRDAGETPELAIEATWGWSLAVDIFQELGATVHLVNPSGLAWEHRRVNGDYRDCCDLLDRMRLGKPPEAWIAPHTLKAQLKAALATHGLRPPVKDL